jgi:hypothetical protein
MVESIGIGDHPVFACSIELGMRSKIMIDVLGMLR